MIKLIWGIRALLYKPFFGRFLFPSYMGKPIFLKRTKNIFIGKRVRIFPNIRLETHTEKGRILIGNNVAIAQNVHITSASNLIIGDNSTILANVFITNIDHDYKEIDKHILNQKMIVSETIIGSNCFIGYGVAIQAGTKLGKQCVVGASAVVRGMFPDYCVIVGAPAKIVKRYNLETKNWERTNPDGSFLKK
jgi:acetyltransferase-like isoleucine patch superfamily enzyme